MADDRKRGTIARLIRDKAYGFITCPVDARDYFFHQRDLTNCTLAQLTEGSFVEFVVEDYNGRPQAMDVELLPGGEFPEGKRVQRTAR